MILTVKEEFRLVISVVSITNGKTTSMFVWFNKEGRIAGREFWGDEVVMNKLWESPAFAVIPKICEENPEITPDTAIIMAIINAKPIIERKECFWLRPIILKMKRKNK